MSEEHKMNTARIRAAADTIDKQSRALEWLINHGHKITGKDDATAYVRIDLLVAEGCDGAKEATKTLEAYSRLSLPSIIEESIRSCRNDIEIARNAIKQELEDSNV